jgi:hypothetical protein
MKVEIACFVAGIVLGRMYMGPGFVDLCRLVFVRRTR